MGWRDWVQVIFPGYYYSNQAPYDKYQEIRRARKRKNQQSTIYESGLQDKTFSPADYGVPITQGYGKFKTDGKVIYGLNEFRDYSRSYEDSGVTIVERVYDIDIAWKLCKGPVVGVSRIWLDDVLILDARNTSTGAVGKDLHSYAVKSNGTVEFVRRMSSDISLETYRIYMGTDTQEPDPMMTTNLGTGQVPAHRGWCYITCSKLYLNPFGRRVPNLVAEIIVSGVSEDVVYGPTTLSNFPPDTGEALVLAARYGMAYASGTNAMVFLTGTSISGAGGNTEDGYQVQAFNPDSREELFNQSIYGNPIDEGGSWVLDNTNNVVWIKDHQSLSVASALTGAKMGAWVISGGAIFVSNSIEYFHATNEIWYTHTVSGVSSINVASAATILAGVSSISPSATLALGFGASQEAGLVYIPHKEWMFALSDSDKRTYKVYSKNREVIFSGILGSSGDVFNAQYAVVDPTNNCLWCITDSTPRYLSKISLVDFATTQVRDVRGATPGNSTPLAIAIDAINGLVICYNDTNSSIEFVNGAGAVELSIDYATYKTTYGRPVALSFLANQRLLVVRAAVRSVLWFKLSRLASNDIAISDIVVDLGEDVGINASDLNVSSMSSIFLNGIAIDERTQAKDVLDVLQRTSFFDLTQEDGKVKAKKRGGASVMTIDYSELLIGEDDEQRRPYDFVRVDELDMPARLEVVYSDADIDYENGLQSSTRHAVRGRNVEKQTIPVLMTASQAKQIAEVELYAQWAQRVGIRLNGTRKHWKLRAGDIFTFVDELGVSRLLLCTKIEFTSMTSCIIEARMEDTSVYTSSASGAGSNWTPPTITASTGKRFELLDIPIIQDADDYQGFYVVALTGAPTAALWESLDGGITYTRKGDIAETVIGYASTALANFTDGNVYDEVSTVTVVVYNGSLASVTDAQLLAGSNLFLVGNEILQAGTVTPSGTNTYILSRLLRGRKGTEWAIGLHSAGERFVNLSTVGRVSSTVRNSLAYYKAVPSGVDINTVTATAFTNTQAGMRPYSPVYITGSRDGGLNLTISWTRRSRIGTAWGSVVDISLGETTEQYQIDIMSGSVVKRTITVNAATTASYSAADQTTDFGSTQASVLVNIYQMSTIVGRGTVGVATV